MTTITDLGDKTRKRIASRGRYLSTFQQPLCAEKVPFQVKEPYRQRTRFGAPLAFWQARA
jgi:hypothetical protein